ncbi:hypothetical protein FHL15_003440 [Xylaria flabelliformis]|uniref:Uncharacterized protein n=1 Tax=Xylaria flabelliformis TaxID=2512241 RepID=A0A553I5K2_9PEZI|nr:hypothetical protein FHL15_003440 [Xylaria flabelliformis]
MQENITVSGPDGEINLQNPLHSYRWQTYPLNETQFPGYGEIGPVTTRHRGENDVSKFIKDPVVSTSDEKPTRIKDTPLMLSSIARFPLQRRTTEWHRWLALGQASSRLITRFTIMLGVVLQSGFDSIRHFIVSQTLHEPGAVLTSKGEAATMDSSLKPFDQVKRTFYTGKTVATTEAFGYTYPDMPGDDQINSLYGGLSATDNWAAASASRRKWFAEIQVDRADLPLPCDIDVYLRDQLAARISLLSYHNEFGGTESRLISDLHVKVTMGSTMLSLRDISSLHINVVGENVTPPSSEFKFPSYTNRTTATVVIVPTLHVLPADVDDHAGPNVGMGRAQQHNLEPRIFLISCVATWNMRVDAEAIIPDPDKHGVDTQDDLSRHIAHATSKK